MQFDFGDVLSRAWQIIWKFKVLWLIGILASCGRGGGFNINAGSGGGGSSSGGSGGSNSAFSVEGQQLFSDQMPEFLRFLEDTPTAVMVMTIILVIFAIIFLALLFSVILFAVRTIGRLGLIQGTLLAEAGAERLGFMQLMSAGGPYFWRALLLNLLIGVVTVLLGILISAPAILITIFTFGLGLLLLIPVLLILGWVVHVFVQQANVALVVEDLDTIGALQKGWEVVRNNWAPPMIIGLVLFVLKLAIGFVAVIPFFLAFGPVIAGLFGGMIADDMNLLWGGLAFTLLCICALLPIFLAVSGAVEAYVESAWTLTYIRLTGYEPSLSELEAGPA
ncbi:MAG: hypothetical protein DWQ07_24825 [Chloroflexi bacterium]|nr:MAG: hypothetical protein DWQ07_24825 [Chloroflexota bacterium]MBL1197083.1 hypothetical protein [Chloroflexota bacterium]NOH14378.1 hypothetical protein [Chloroflexota bacterium]